MLLAFLLGACAETQPETRIIAEGTTGQAPLTVSFTSDSRGFDEYRWDFGDGTFTNTSTSFPVDHEYTKVGSYLVTLTVIREADPPKSTTATVTISVEPGPLESLVLDLDEVVLAPREEHVFLVSAFDQFDNPIPGLEPDYQVDDQAGSVDGHGNFTAATTAGTYTGALNVHLSQGSITRSASASVIIEPGSLDRAALEPIAVSIDILDVIKLIPS